MHNLGSLLAIGVCVLWISACSCGDDATRDAGPDAAASSDAGDASITLCAANRDCDDGEYCNGAESCEPGSPTAGPDGCVPGAPPCAADACDETEDRCDCGAASDADSDGHDAEACGGDDCDDDDANRYPGNEEVCDEEGHDEDCDPSTVGDRDDDSDGFVDDACCNGDTCGEDCNDATRSVAPGVADVCDAIDNDCDTRVDESSGEPLCPGGTCAAGLCSFRAWDRTFGASDAEFAYAVDFDDLGRVYIAGTTAAGFSLESEIVGARQAFVAAFETDGTLRYVYSTVGATTVPTALKIAAAGDGAVYMGGLRSGDIDFGDGVVSGSTSFTGFVLRLEPDGSFDWARTFDGGNAQDLSVLDDGSVVVSGTLFETDDLGGGERPISSSHGYVAAYATDGAWLWDALIAGNTSLFTASTVDRVYVAGSWSTGTVELDGVPYTPDGFDFFVVELDRADGSLTDHAVFSQPGTQQVGTLGVDGAARVYVGGSFEGSATWAGDSLSSDPSDELAGFILALDAELEPRWAREVDGEGVDSVDRLQPDSADDVVVAGSFRGRIDFGAGIRGMTGARYAYAVRYAPGGALRADDILLYRFPESSAFITYDWAVGPGRAVAVAGAFSGSVDLGSGDKSSAGSVDGFVVRLGE